MEGSPPGEEFAANYVARAKELLASSQAGSHDAQNFVDGIEQFSACNAIFAEERPGRPPLSARERQQAMVHFLRAVQAIVSLPARTISFREATFNGLVAAAEEVVSGSRFPGNRTLVSPHLLLAHLADNAVFVCETGLEQVEGRKQKEEGMNRCLHMSRVWPVVWAEPAAALERYLRGEGFAPLLTAAELRALPLLLAMDAALMLAQEAQGGGQQERGWAFAAQGAAACAELMALHPGRAGSWGLRRCVCLLLGPPSQYDAALAALRDAFAQADASTDHWTVACAAQNLVGCLVGCPEGRRFSVGEAVHALERGEHHERLAAACLPPGLRLGKVLAQTRRSLEGEIAAAGPGAAELPCRHPNALRMGQASDYTKRVARQRCSLCRRWALQLKRCGQCRAVAYCSVASQRKHWGEGGHKEACAALAAERAEREQSGAGAGDAPDDEE